MTELEVDHRQLFNVGDAVESVQGLDSGGQTMRVTKFRDTNHEGMVYTVESEDRKIGWSMMPNWSLRKA